MYSPAHKHLGGRQEEGEFESSQDFRESPCEGKEEAVPRRSECICPTHLLTAVPGVVQWFPGFADNWSRSTLDVLMSC